MPNRDESRRPGCRPSRARADQEWPRCNESRKMPCISNLEQVRDDDSHGHSGPGYGTWTDEAGKYLVHSDDVDPRLEGGGEDGSQAPSAHGPSRSAAGAIRDLWPDCAGPSDAASIPRPSGAHPRPTGQAAAGPSRGPTQPRCDRQPPRSREFEASRDRSRGSPERRPHSPPPSTPPPGRRRRSGPG